MTRNLDDLAKLAPFTIHGSEAPWSEAGGQWIGLHALVAIANEWAELRAYRERTEAALRARCAAIASEIAYCQDPKNLANAYAEDLHAMAERLNVMEGERQEMEEAGLWRDPAPKEDA